MVHTCLCACPADVLLLLMSSTQSAVINYMCR